MSIQASELIWVKSVEVNDENANGGRMGTVLSVDGAKNNVFPDVSQADRTNGNTKYRKVFIKVNNSEITTQAPYPDIVGLPLIQPRLYVEKISNGDDCITFFVGTQTDTQNTINQGTIYGAGLTVGSSSGSTINVTPENWAAGAIFRNGDLIRISTKTNINDGAGLEEYHTISVNPVTSGNPVNNVQLTISGTLSTTFPAGSKVASVYTYPTDVKATVTGAVTSGAPATVDPLYIALDNSSAVEDTWTLTVQANTAQFTIVGANTGPLTTGDRIQGSGWTATKDGKTMFRIMPQAWTGTWAQNNTMTFTTHPAAIPIWIKRTVRVDATSISSNESVIVIDGESG